MWILLKKKQIVVHVDIFFKGTLESVTPDVASTVGYETIVTITGTL